MILFAIWKNFIIIKLEYNVKIEHMFDGEIMVKQYLEKVKEQLLERKIVVSNHISELSNTYKENIEFIKMLEETNDPNFESFTPREVNGFNRKKIVELESMQKSLTEELTKARQELSELDSDIYELNSVIKVARENIRGLSTQVIDEKDSEFRFALLETQENERQRIARELHDSTVQNLISLVHKTELCMKLFETDPIRCKLELSSMGKVLRDIIEDARNMIYDLRPMSFDDIGFDITVERLLDKIKSITGKNITLKVIGNTYSIHNIVGITLLRVIQEACNNAIKHSYASEVKVTLYYNHDNFIVEVADNGKGFTKEEVESGVSREDNSGFGLSIMRERIYLLSGELEIESAPGKGCIIKAIIPMIKESI